MPLFTGKDLTDDRTVSCDVCVVGSGAGGAHVAQRLAEAGRRVVVLEEGGYHTSEKFNMDEADMYALLYQERGNRATADLSINIAQGRSVGGTTVVNWTTSYRTPRRVLEWWAAHHGIEGLSYKALEPHWERVEKRLSIEEIPIEAMNANNRVLWDGARKLGWHVHLLKRNVDRCARLGYCGMGCPIDAKQSMLITLLPDALALGADLYANVRAEGIETDGRRVTRVRGVVLDPTNDRPTGRTVTVEARHTVLSGGGINNPLLLLRAGVGNRNGRVGRRTFLHPASPLTGFFADPIESFYGAPQAVASLEFAQSDETQMGFFIEVGPGHPMFSAAYAPGKGEGLRYTMERLAHLNAMAAVMIDGFDPSDLDEGATVTLRPDGRPRVDYKWTPRFVDGLKRGAQRVAQIQLAAGAVETRSFHIDPVVIKTEADLAKFTSADWRPARHRLFSAHVMGGCAMGADPKTSVVDSTFRHHEFDNLSIIDGSVLPTSLGVNPQLTIYGLASWGAEHVRQALG